MSSMMEIVNNYDRETVSAVGTLEVIALRDEVDYCIVPGRCGGVDVVFPFLRLAVMPPVEGKGGYVIESRLWPPFGAKSYPFRLVPNFALEKHEQGYITIKII